MKLTWFVGFCIGLYKGFGFLGLRVIMVCVFFLCFFRIQGFSALGL